MKKRRQDETRREARQDKGSERSHRALVAADAPYTPAVLSLARESEEEESKQVRTHIMCVCVRFARVDVRVRVCVRVRVRVCVCVYA